MSTATRPRPRAKPIPRPVPHAELVAAARKEISTTKRQVTTTMKADDVNRSTRAQRAQRMKAEAFDRLDEILAGR